MKEYIIYKITNPIGQIYIGQTNNFKRRMQEYRKYPCCSQKLLNNSFIKYGFDNHSIEIIDKSYSDDLNILEIHYINEYKSYYFDNITIGLNQTKGGKTLRGWYHSEETKKKFSVIRKGKQTWIKKGHNPSEITRLKMSNTRKNLYKTGIVKNKQVALIQYDLQGNFIKEWDTIKDASNSINRSPSTVGEHIRKGKDYLINNYRFTIKNSQNHE